VNDLRGLLALDREGAEVDWKNEVILDPVAAVAPPSTSFAFD
jgi:hypothetical protein